VAICRSVKPPLKNEEEVKSGINLEVARNVSYYFSTAIFRINFIYINDVKSFNDKKLYRTDSLHSLKKMDIPTTRL